MLATNKGTGVIGDKHAVSKCPICEKPAGKTCSACHQVSYCSAEHQKKHWKVHKRSCKSFVVKRNEYYGRYLVATRDIPQGTVIFTEEPLTYGPKRSTFPVCLGCHKRVDGTYRCSKCTYPMCSEECEKLAIHAENECLVFQNGAHPVGSKISNFDAICPAYECITPLRCVLLKKRNPAKWVMLVTMEHHNELRKSIPGLWNRNHVNVVKLLMEWYKIKEDEDLAVDEETIHSVMGYIDVNCFEIKYKGVEICGVYRDGGLMSHACVPNTHHAISVTPEDHKMIVRSSIPIKKGEMITTSYANQLSGTRERRWFLKDTKYFDCLCERCEDPTEYFTYLSGVKCSECSTGYLLPKNTSLATSIDWICTNISTEDKLNNNEPSRTTASGSSAKSCSRSIKEEQIQNILRKVRKEIEEVSRSTAGSPISRMERLLKKFSGKVLHPNHFLLLDVIKSLSYSYAKQNENIMLMHGTSSESGSNNNGRTDVNEKQKDEVDLDHLQRSRSLCTQLLSVLDMIDPGLTRLRGVTLYQLSLAEYHIARIKFQRKELNSIGYVESLTNILAYLKTSKDIIELDKFVTPDAPVLYHKILDQIKLIGDRVAALTFNAV